MSALPSIFQATPIQSRSCGSCLEPLLLLSPPLFCFHLLLGIRYQQLWKRCSAFPLHWVALWGLASSSLVVADQMTSPPKKDHVIRSSEIRIYSDERPVHLWVSQHLAISTRAIEIMAGVSGCCLDIGFSVVPHREHNNPLKTFHRFTNGP